MVHFSRSDRPYRSDQSDRPYRPYRFYKPYRPYRPYRVYRVYRSDFCDLEKFRAFFRMFSSWYLAGCSGKHKYCTMAGVQPSKLYQINVK